MTMMVLPQPGQGDLKPGAAMGRPQYWQTKPSLAMDHPLPFKAYTAEHRHALGWC
jgi:hypothetical protein